MEASSDISSLTSLKGSLKGCDLRNTSLPSAELKHLRRKMQKRIAFHRTKCLALARILGAIETELSRRTPSQR